MGILLRNNPKIRGITIDNIEYKVFQYADDTGIFLDGSEESLSNALDLVDQFSKFSGLKPNFEKNKCVWIGSSKQCGRTLCTYRKLDWINDTFTVLGVIFSTNLKSIPRLNYNERLKDIKKIFCSMEQEKPHCPR